MPDATPRRPLNEDSGLPYPPVKVTQTDEAPALPSKQVLQGYLTTISLVVTALGLAAKAFGWHFPESEVQSLLTWLLANWDSLMSVAGILMAAYAQLRRNWRHEVVASTSISTTVTATTKQETTIPPSA